ncbi:DedA family protein [Ferrimicrobium acidiphilum]|uniref:DedA family protein n=1 Tax=Ferrimicrobium acidiphilum TaxID=121039 RepID=UPI0023F0551C|nr:DedA family protein [Ferrimicrobium acidiphilum]
MNFLVSRLLSVPSLLALVLVFALPALEASIFLGFIFPGETAVVLGGVLAAEGRFPVWLVGGIAAAGAIIGDSVGYWVGSRYGPWLIGKIPRRLLKPESLDKAIDLLRRRGGLGVFVGRFTTVLRVLIPGAAGIAGMRYRRFLFFNALGGICWAGFYTTLGYVAGANYASVLKDASTTSEVILAVVVILFFGVGLYRHFGPPLRRPKASSDESTPEE